MNRTERCSRLILAAVATLALVATAPEVKAYQAGYQTVTYYSAIYVQNSNGSFCWDNGQVSHCYVQQFVPINAALWYPTDATASAMTYLSGQQLHITGQVAQNAAISSGQFPLIVFSHGETGCGLQSVYITEE